MTDPTRPLDLRWKPDWATARANHEAWWAGAGLVLWVTAPADQPHELLPPPPAAADLNEQWFGAAHRVRQGAWHLSRTFFGGDAFPLLGTHSAAGDLTGYVGCRLDLHPSTVWSEPCIGEPPEAHPPIAVDRASQPYLDHRAMLALSVAESDGRWLTSLPDLVENLDILAAMRGAELLMTDLLDRPEWVLSRLDEINDAYFDIFDEFAELTRDGHGANCFCFSLWGPGRTAKVQCDAAAMLSPAMFRRFVVPALSRQCERLDYAMFHLDGEDCLCHVDALLAIDSLNAIEWTPRRLSVGDSGGHPRHWELYQRILAGGKAVQAVGVRYDEVLPLLDACGGDGMYIQTSAPTEAAARELVERVASYRRPPAPRGSGAAAGAVGPTTGASGSAVNA